MVAAPTETAPAFFGRAAELQALAAALELARSGRGRLVAVGGEAGIGKTRLVEELIRTAGLSPSRVLWGRCLEQAGTPSYWPWIRVLRSLAEQCGLETLRADLGADAALLAALVPGLGSGGGAPAAGADGGSRYHLFSAVLGLLRRQAAGDPLVVVLEDVHWADEASLALLELVASELDDARLLVVITYRDRERPRLPRSLVEAVRRAERLTLRGLESPAVAAIVARAAGDRADPAMVGALAERLTSATMGNPFFLGEVLRGLTQEGRLSEALASNGPLALPDTVRDSIRRHLEPLSEAERDLLAYAAVAGDEFETPLLCLAARVEPTALLTALAAPVDLGVVVQLPGGRFRFAHALLRETIYGDLRPAERVQLHERIGTALEQLFAGNPSAPLGTLASHFLHAAPLGTAAKAATYAERAAQQAMAVHAHGDALEAYEQALAALDVDAADRSQRLGLRLAAADAARRAGHDQRAKELFRLAAQDARALGDRSSHVIAAIGYYLVSPNLADTDPATITLLEEALATLSPRDSETRAIVTAILGAARYYTLGSPDGAAMTVAAVEMARRLGKDWALATALLARQLVVVGPGSTDERLALADEALALAERSMPDVEHLARASRVHAFLERGETAEASAEVERMARTAHRVREPVRQWQVTVRRAGIALFEGRFDDGARLAAEALAARRYGGDPTALEVFVLQMFLARRDPGQHGGLGKSLRWMVEHYPESQIWPAVLALHYADMGNVERARQAFEVVARPGFDRLRPHQNYAPVLAWLARVSALVQDEARAADLYPRLLPFAEQNLVLGPHSHACLGSAQRYLGVLAMTQGEIELALRHYEAALAMNERMGARPLVACCLHELARVLERRSGPGDRERGRELLARASVEARACELAQLLGWIEFLGPIPDQDAKGASTDSGQAPVQAPGPRVAAAGAALAPPPASVAEAPAASARAARSTPPTAGAGTAESVAVFRREGDVWLVGFADEAVRMKDAKGAHLLARLLQCPGQEIHVLELAAGAPGGAGGEPGDLAADLGDAGPLIDVAARAAYRSRLEDLRDELEEAQRFNDTSRAARAQQEIDFLADELARGVGLGGRERRAASSAERARVNATRSIGKVVRRIGELAPRLGEHLRGSVRTGYLCTYAPDPSLRIRWEF